MSDEQFREDELVSAYLDGEATPAEIAEVERNDVLMARVEQLRSVRDAVATPVAPMPEGRRDQLISAALAVADAGTAQHRGARIVPVRRRRETLLAVAAAAILVAAAVSAGLIASRGGDDEAEIAAATDDSAEMALDAPAAVADAEAAAAAPAEADMAMAEDSADYEMAAEPVTTAVPAEADMAMADDSAGYETAAEPMPEEEPTVELESAMAAAEAESATEAPVEEAADAPTASAEEERRTADEAAVPVVDLGAFEDLQSLFDDIAASWSAALEDGTTADPETCSAAVHERELELDVEAGRAFIATVGAEDPLVIDGRLARRADGTAIIIYAAPPSCETGIYEQDESDGS